MKLSDVMSAMNLATYAEIALVIFMLVFVGAVLHVFRRDRRAEYARAKRIPLDDERPTTDLDGRDEP